MQETLAGKSDRKLTEFFHRKLYHHLIDLKTMRRCLVLVVIMAVVIVMTTLNVCTRTTTPLGVKDVNTFTVMLTAAPTSVIAMLDTLAPVPEPDLAAIANKKICGSDQSLLRVEFSHLKCSNTTGICFHYA
ncbi:MAG: hypothetical protein WCF90_10470 [Methanomicrobiales archaeon]